MRTWVSSGLTVEESVWGDRSIERNANFISDMCVSLDTRLTHDIFLCNEKKICLLLYFWFAISNEILIVSKIIIVWTVLVFKRLLLNLG